MSEFSVLDQRIRAVLAPGTVADAATLCDALVAQGNSRCNAYNLISRGVRVGLLERWRGLGGNWYQLRSGYVPKPTHAGSPVPTPLPDAAVQILADRDRPAGAPTAYVGPAFAAGDLAQHTGTPCGDEDLPPVIAARYRDTVGRLFDRAAGFIGEVE